MIEMPKFPERKISKLERDRILYSLCSAFANLRNSQEVAQFLRDLLGPKEMEMLAMRLLVAQCLHKGMTYQEINNIYKIAYTTIARVAAWSEQFGEGFRLVLSRMRTIAEVKLRGSPTAWSVMKRKYPLYFWPQLLLEEIVRSASLREKKRLKSVIETLSMSNQKSRLYKDLQALLQ